MKKTNPLKIVEIENYANNLRKELGIPSNSFFSSFRGNGKISW